MCVYMWIMQGKKRRMRNLRKFAEIPDGAIVEFT